MNKMWNSSRAIQPEKHTLTSPRTRIYACWVEGGPTLLCSGRYTYIHLHCMHYARTLSVYVYSCVLFTCENCWAPAHASALLQHSAVCACSLLVVHSSTHRCNNNIDTRTHVRNAPQPLITNARLLQLAGTAAIMHAVCCILNTSPCVLDLFGCVHTGFCWTMQPNSAGLTNQELLRIDDSERGHVNLCSGNICKTTWF